MVACYLESWTVKKRRKKKSHWFSFSTKSEVSQLHPALTTSRWSHFWHTPRQPNILTLNRFTFHYGHVRRAQMRVLWLVCVCLLCLQGKLVHQSFSIQSSFTQKVRLQQIRSLTEDVRFYYKRLRNNKDELEPRRKSKVGPPIPDSNSISGNIFFTRVFRIHRCFPYILYYV